MLAHKAEEEGIAFAERLAGLKPHVNYDTIPGIIYTWPEVASVGLTEEQVKESGKKYKVGKFNIGVTGRAKCLDETEGFVKIIADADTDRILGMHVIGPRASESAARALVSASGTSTSRGAVSSSSLTSTASPASTPASWRTPRLRPRTNSPRMRVTVVRQV